MSCELQERNGRRNPVASVVNAKGNGSCGLVYSAIAPSADVGVAKPICLSRLGVIVYKAVLTAFRSAEGTYCKLRAECNTRRAHVCARPKTGGQGWLLLLNNKKPQRQSKLYFKSLHADWTWQRPIRSRPHSLSSSCTCQQCRPRTLRKCQRRSVKAPAIASNLARISSCPITFTSAVNLGWYP